MRRTRRARRLTVTVIVGTVILGVAGAISYAALTGNDGGSGHSSPPTTPHHGAPSRLGSGPTTTASTEPAVNADPRQPVRNLAITTTQVQIVDPSRPVVREGVTESSERALPTSVWMPTPPGRYPLIVFVHGYNVGPSTYQRFLSTLASSGYVVAAPSFPLEDPSRGYGLDRADLPNEATDVSFVITSLLGGPLASRIDATRIGVVGHSDGADVALMVGYQVGKVDSRVGAIVSDAPDPMTGAIAPSGVPLLLMQGTADSVVPYSASQEVFQQVSAPRYYLSLLGADHLPPIQGGTAWTPVVDTSVADFLDATIAGRSPLGSLPAELDALPLSRFIFGAS
jgi:fermentation-respiration switch protein FrsA (DUF1100 family)